MPRRVQLDDRDGHMLPTGIKNVRVFGAANGPSILTWLVQGIDDSLEARLRLEIELGRTESLAFKAGRSEPLEHIERGHRGAVGEATIEWAEANRSLFTRPGRPIRRGESLTAGTTVDRVEPRRRFLRSGDGMDMVFAPWLNLNGYAGPVGPLSNYVWCPRNEEGCIRAAAARNRSHAGLAGRADTISLN